MQPRIAQLQSLCAPYLGDVSRAYFAAHYLAPALPWASTRSINVAGPHVSGYPQQPLAADWRFVWQSERMPSFLFSFYFRLEAGHPRTGMTGDDVPGVSSFWRRS